MTADRLDNARFATLGTRGSSRMERDVAPLSARRRRVATGAGRAKSADKANARGVRTNTATRYESDNRVVEAVYSFTAGGGRPLFVLLVILSVMVGLYFPVRDCYIAHRTQDILQQQVEIREKYNDAVAKEVDGLLSQEGVEDAARKKLGMVMPGEKTITVTGLDEDGNPVTADPEDQDARADATAAENQDAGDGGVASGSALPQAAAAVSGATTEGDDASDQTVLKGADAVSRDKTGAADGVQVGDEPTTSVEVAAAEHAVYENSAWYWKMLDSLFFFDGAHGMAVVSTGDGA